MAVVGPSSEAEKGNRDRVQAKTKTAVDERTLHEAPGTAGTEGAIIPRDGEDERNEKEGVAARGDENIILPKIKVPEGVRAKPSDSKAKSSSSFNAEKVSLLSTRKNGQVKPDRSSHRELQAMDSATNDAARLHLNGNLSGANIGALSKPGKELASPVRAAGSPLSCSSSLSLPPDLWYQPCMVEAIKDEYS